MEFTYLLGFAMVVVICVIILMYLGILAANGIPEVGRDSVVKFENILSTAKVDMLNDYISFFRRYGTIEF